MLADFQILSFSPELFFKRENNHIESYPMKGTMGRSNNSVDDIRNLVDQVRFAPQLGSYNIYIIDEVHMLTNQAFNALLRTLEEPPSHGKFIFCTTDIHKVPATIISRCQRFDFNRISLHDIIARLELILKSEEKKYDKESLVTIAR